jgi:hypothetical protein
MRSIWDVGGRTATYFIGFWEEDNYGAQRLLKEQKYKKEFEQKTGQEQFLCSRGVGRQRAG